MLIQILCDNPSSWIIPYAKELVNELTLSGNMIRLIHHKDEVVSGDILIMLSCEHLFRNLSLNKFNLVVHESDLPKGKGWSPLTWQVLEGKNKIPVTLIEATEGVDAGPIYDQIIINLNGTELVDELRKAQGEATKELIRKFVKNYPNNTATPQQGEESFYPRRKPEDGKLDIHVPLKDQFNLLRVSDNERYPAWFEIDGVTYQLKIYKK